MNCNSKRYWVATAALLAATGVALGAIAAHGVSEPAAAQAIERASTLQLIHAVALLALGLTMTSLTNRYLVVGRWLLLLGIVGFSGAIYAKYLIGIASLGAMAPYGGMSLILGWMLIAVGALVQRTDTSMP
jgi:uncharacterized membrane protein YgdD (TMEM256/DUF423 family)